MNYFTFSGTVIEGDQIGNPFGVATANIAPHEHTPLESGVYLVDAIIEQEKYSGLMHYGELKTFGREFRIEIHVLNFNKNIYSQDISITPLKYLRSIRKFKNADLLFTQIEQDIVTAEKFFLRRNIWNTWKEISQEEQGIMINKVVQELKNNSIFKKAKTIGLYAPIKEKEIFFVQKLCETFPEKKYAFPYTEHDYKLNFFLSKYNDLVPGKYNIPEPKRDHPVKISDIDLLMVPLVAGNVSGQRLGQGGGFYDRLLAEYAGPTIGFLPHFANIAHIPTEAHDKKIQQIVFV